MYIYSIPGRDNVFLDYENHPICTYGYSVYRSRTYICVYIIHEGNVFTRMRFHRYCVSDIMYRKAPRLPIHKLGVCGTMVFNGRG